MSEPPPSPSDALAEAAATLERTLAVLRSAGERWAELHVDQALRLVRDASSEVGALDSER